MKYALGEGRQTVTPHDVGGVRKREEQDHPAGPATAVDPGSLAAALDQLAREVLNGHRPLQEAWEELRRQVLCGLDPGAGPATESPISPLGGLPLNCWEHFGCGREPGGRRAAELGVCPATLAREADGVNGGHNAGRICWVIARNHSDGPPGGTLARGRGTCARCTFRRAVQEDADLPGDRGPAPRRSEDPSGHI